MKVSIIGSGVSGICAAIRLRSKGFAVDVYEKNKTPGGKLNTFKFKYQIKFIFFLIITYLNFILIFIQNFQNLLR